MKITIIILVVLINTAFSKTVITQAEEPRRSSLIKKNESGELIIISYHNTEFTNEFEFYIEYYDGVSLNELGRFNYNKKPFIFESIDFSEDRINLIGYRVGSLGPYPLDYDLFTLKTNSNESFFNLDTSKNKSYVNSLHKPPLTEYKNKIISVARNYFNEIVYQEYDIDGNFEKEYRLDSISLPLSFEPSNLFEYNDNLFLIAAFRNENNIYNTNLYKVDSEKLLLIDTLVKGKYSFNTNLLVSDEYLYLNYYTSTQVDYTLELLKYNIGTKEIISTELVKSSSYAVPNGIFKKDDFIFSYGSFFNKNYNPFIIKTDLNLNKIDEQILNEPQKAIELTFLDYNDGKYQLVGNFQEDQYFITEYTPSSVENEKSNFKGSFLVQDNLLINTPCKKINSCRIIDSNGKSKSIKPEILNDSINFNISNFSSGLYILEISSCNKIDFYLVLKE